MTTFVNFAGDLLTFDAKTTETYTEDANVTEHPIESGGFVTDHIQAKPMIVKIEGIVSESPFSGQLPEDEVLGGNVAGHRGLTALKFFRESRHETFDWIGNRLGLVPRLVLQSIETNVPNTDSTEFRLTLKQISYAQAQLVDLPPEFVPPRFQPAKQCTEQPTTTLTDEANGRPASIAHNLDDFTNDFFSKLGTKPADFWNKL